MTVVTLNTHAGSDASRVPSLDRQAAAVCAAGADLVCLQEVDVGTQRSGGEDQVRRWSQALGLPYYAFGPAMVHDAGWYGNAVLSRWPITCAMVTPFRPIASEPFTHVDGKTRSWPQKAEPRSAMITRIATPAGELTVVSAHLSLFAPERVAAVTDLLSVLGPGPVLAGMDLNVADEDAVERRLLMTRLTDLTAGTPAYRAPTHPVGAIDAASIDVLLGAAVQPVSARMLEATGSDHHGVCVQFRLR